MTPGPLFAGRHCTLAGAEKIAADHGLKSQKLQVLDDIVDVLVGQHDEPAEGPRSDRILSLGEIEEPLIVSDGVAKGLGAVVVEVRCGVLDAPQRRNLEEVRKESTRDDKRWRRRW